MKNIYFLAAALFCSSISAQTTISFESSEGYALGNINNQNGWTVTQTSDGPLTNQIVTNEVASAGTYSFKNAYVPEYGDQWFPIFGVEKSFFPALDYKNTTISYDFYAPQQGGADFEFALYSINEEEDVFDILLAVGFENRGLIYIYPEKNFGGFTYAEAEWQANQWYNLKVEIKEETIKYFLNGAEIHSGPNTTKVNVNGMNFLHNNFGGSAYYDNIVVNGTNMSTTSVQKGSIKVYPNPVIDVVTIELPQGEKLDGVEIYSLSGQKVVSIPSDKNLNLSKLQSGGYILKAKTIDGKTYTSKIIKK